jgi:hypothetical protein
MIWESVVLTHLTTKEGLFVRRQYDIDWDKETGEGGSCPDFIAIDPKKPGLIYVVEVSAAWDLKNLSEKFEKREKHWYGPLRKLSIWGHSGPFEFKSVAYVRKDAGKFTCSGRDIERRSLEDITFPWL